MAAEIMLVAERRRPAVPPAELPSAGVSPADVLPAEISLRQFTRDGDEMTLRSRPVPSAERPPARSVPNAGRG
jgi:hypothetical protein